MSLPLDSELLKAGTVVLLIFDFPRPGAGAQLWLSVNGFHLHNYSGVYVVLARKE